MKAPKGFERAREVILPCKRETEDGTCEADVFAWVIMEPVRKATRFSPAEGGAAQVEVSEKCECGHVLTAEEMKAAVEDAEENAMIEFIEEIEAAHDREHDDE